MIADAEVIKVINDILVKLDIGRFCIKINHRKLLESMFEVSGCDLKMFATICSSIDKLDKETWENVRKELLDKGLTNESCDILHEFVLKKDEPNKLIEYLLSSKLYQTESGKLAIDDLVKLESNLRNLDSLSNCKYDLSLARGLD